MRKSEKSSVAIFLAAALLTGIFAVSAPTIVDTEATEDKNKYYKQKDRDGDRNGHGDYSRDGDGKDRDGDYSSYYSKDRDGKDRHGDYSRDGDRDHDGKGDVKYISCKNININGKSFTKGGGHDGPRDIGINSLRDGGHDGFMNGNTNSDRFIKETHKDVTVICIQNNDGGNQTVPPVTGCLGCFTTTDDGGFLPPGQLTNLIEYLADFGETLQSLCDAIEAGDITELELASIINSALPGAEPSLVAQLIACLDDFFPEE